MSMDYRHSGSDRSAASTKAHPALASTKVVPPWLRPNHVSRGKPAALFDEAAHRPVTLVVAPAGWGKTSALAEWALSSHGVVSWLRCDHHDDDPAWLAADLVWSVRAAAPEACESAVDLVEADASPDAVLGRLVEVVARLKKPITTVMDNWHAVTAPAARHALGSLVESLPSNWHLVIASRSTGPQELGWADGVSHVAAEDLSFDDDANLRLLRELFDLPVGRSAAARLNGRARGWAAGLCIAGHDARSAGDVDVALGGWTGSHPHLADYLATEVLGAADDRLRGFLLDTAVLAPFRADLCDAVTGREDSAEMIGKAQGRQLFIREVDGRAGWFTYDDLVLEGLRYEARRRQPERCDEMLQLAVDWVVGEGIPDLAISYAVAAGLHEVAGGLIGQHGYALIDQGLGRDVIGWLEAIPPRVLDASPELHLLAAQAAWWAGDFDTHPVHLSRARDTARRHPDRARGSAVLAATAVAVPIELARRGLTEDALALATATVTVPSDSGTGDYTHFGTDVARMRNALAVLAYWAGSLDLAAGHVAAALAAAPDNHARLNALGLRAMTAFLDGDEASALVAAREAATVMGDLDAHPFQATWAANAIAWTGSAAEAQWADAMVRAVPTVGVWWITDVHVALMASEVQLRRGGVADARRLAEQAQRIIAGVEQPGVMARLVDVQLSRIDAHIPDADPLAITDRERAVLALLAGSLSRREIGVELEVSLNTVKTHMRQLYRKLGADSRTEAVRRGRDLNIL